MWRSQADARKPHLIRVHIIEARGLTGMWVPPLCAAAAPAEPRPQGFIGHVGHTVHNPTRPDEPAAAHDGHQVQDRERGLGAVRARAGASVPMSAGASAARFRSRMCCFPTKSSPRKRCQCRSWTATSSSPTSSSVRARRRAVRRWRLLSSHAAACGAGQFEFSLENIYRQKGHEYYRRWVPLTLPSEPGAERGYLLIRRASCPCVCYSRVAAHAHGDCPLQTRLV